MRRESPSSRKGARAAGSGRRTAACYKTRSAPAKENPIELILATFPAVQAQVPYLSDLSGGAIVAVIALLVFSLGFHEAAHGWVALRCGDTTARDLGRITLNPIPHIDPFMTILLPVVLALTSPFVFGGAKPVPVSFHRLRRPWRDMALVALAGPLSNLLLAAVFYAAFHAIQVTGFYADRQLPHILNWVVAINLLLAVFNVLPIPPLDGSRVMAWILPEPLRAPFGQLERFGLLLIFALLMMGVLHGPLFAAINAMFRGVKWFVTLGGLW